MLQEERFVKIIEFMKSKGSARFSDIAKFLSVSEGTVRKDFAELDRRNLIKLVRGGAVWGKQDVTKGVSQVRDIINREEKQELVKGLGDIIQDGQAVTMNGGTTSIEAAKFLAKNYENLTVITNNLTVLSILREKKNFQLILTGGKYYMNENTITGKQVERDVELYNADLAILAVNSISIEKGITDFRMEESGIINSMIRTSQKAVVLADHSKFDRIAHINVCGLDKISYFLTDSGLTNEIVKKYEKKGCRILK